MKRTLVIIIVTVLTSCIKDDSVPIVFEDIVILGNELGDNLYQTDAIFAFAANDQTESAHTNIYTVIENGATDIKFYESDYPNINSQDLFSYKLMEIQPSLINDAKVKTYRHTFLRDEWIIMTYKIDNKIKLSSPVRINNLFHPTNFIEAVNIDQDLNGSASFNWDVQSYDANAFFFEIMKDDNSQVLSLTFTNDSNFQYFNLANVTLNLSENTPPSLEQGRNYDITILDIGLDNWINSVYNRTFNAE